MANFVARLPVSHIMRPIALLLLLVVTACSAPPAIPARERFTTAMTTGEAIEGEMHGVYPELRQYVFTYRTPKKFFDFVEVSLVTSDPALDAQLAALRRHDRVRITGQLLDNPSPQMHVKLGSLELVKEWQPEPAMIEYEYEASVPRDLEGRNEATFLVHAVHAEGSLLVVEYHDVVLPIYVKRPELAKDLARNDVVRLQYVIRMLPHRPVHLELAEVEKPIEVLESVFAMDGKPASVEGALVLFPKSPQVIFNVFAVLQELPNGLQRQYTLLPPPPEDPALQAEFDAKFKAVRDKLQAAWDAAGAEAAVSGRNKLISTKVRVRATGKFNEEQANQANVQIYLDGPESVEIVAG